MYGDRRGNILAWGYSEILLASPLQAVPLADGNQKGDHRARIGCLYELARYAPREPKSRRVDGKVCGEEIEEGDVEAGITEEAVVNLVDS